MIEPNAGLHLSGIPALIISAPPTQWVSSSKATSRVSRTTLEFHLPVLFQFIYPFYHYYYYYFLAVPIFTCCVVLTRVDIRWSEKL